MCIMGLQNINRNLSRCKTTFKFLQTRDLPTHMKNTHENTRHRFKDMFRALRPTLGHKHLCSQKADSREWRPPGGVLRCLLGTNRGWDAAKQRNSRHRWRVFPPGEETAWHRCAMQMTHRVPTHPQHPRHSTKHSSHSTTLAGPCNPHCHILRHALDPTGLQKTEQQRGIPEKRDF